MAGYNFDDAAYNFDLFDYEYIDSKSLAKTSEVERRRQQIVLYENKKAKMQPKTQPKLHPYKNAFKIFQLLILCLALFLPIFSSINARRQIDEISKNIEKQKILLAEEKSEKIRLDAEVNAKMTINKIEDYATNVLGMVKLTPYNVSYYDFSGEDCVVLCSKSENDDNLSFVQKILSYFD